jgi:hypothetical protein
VSDLLIRQAFETRLAAWAAAQTPPIPVTFENHKFKPPAGRYIRCWLLPAPTQSESLDGLHRLRSGIFQVDLCMPNGEGAGAATALAASLDAAFSLTSPMTQGSIKVFMLSPMSAAPAMQEPNHYVVPVSGEYRSDTI